MRIQEQEFSRRILFEAALLFVHRPYTSSGLFVREQPRVIEQEQKIPDGSIMSSPSGQALLNNGKLYTLPLRYVHNSRFLEHGGTIVSVNRLPMSEYPPGVLEQEAVILDVFTGQPEHNKINGGEMNIFWGGFMTDVGGTYIVILPWKDTFQSIRGKQGLGQQGWTELDYLFFTYGKEDLKLERYGVNDTVADPVKNMRHAIVYYKRIKEQFPLARFNFIAHSLGGIYALEVAMEMPELINNLIFIGCPLTGFPDDWFTWVKAKGAKSLIDAFIEPNEEVIDYLLQAGGNSEYQKKANEFSRRFTQRGGGILYVANTQDGVVPYASATLSHGKQIVEPMGAHVDVRKTHGYPLWYPRAMEAINEQIGEKRAA